MAMVYSLIECSASWAKYALIVYLFLNLFLRFLLPLFLPFSTSIGHLSPTALHDISVSWRGLQLKVRRMGFSLRGGGGRGTAWWVFYGEGVKLSIPRAALLELLSNLNPTASSDSKEKGRPGSDPCATSLPPSQPSPSRRIFLPFLVRRLLHVISVRINVTVDVEEVGVVEGTLKLGGHYKKPHLRVPIVGTPRREDKLRVWASVENLRLTEALRGLDQKEHKKLLPAVELREKITFSLSGPVGYEEWKTLKPREGSIRASMEREQEKDRILGRMKRSRPEEGEQKGLVVRIHQIKGILRNVEELHSEIQQVRQQSKPQPGSSSPSPPSSQPPPSQKPSPLIYFDSFSITLPDIIFSLHYTTPISVMASSSPSVNQSLPQTIAFAAILSGIKGNLKLKAKSEGESTRDAHKAYLGRGRLCEVIGSIGWDELEGRIDVDGKEEDIASPTAKTLSIGRSEISLTSTWLPFPPSSSTPTCDKVVSQYTKKPRHTLPTPSNYNDSTIIVEMSLGEVRGQTTFEDLDAAVRIFNARPRTPSRSAPSTPQSQTDFPSRKDNKSFNKFPDLPRFVTSCTVASLEVRLVAPTDNTSSADRPHPGPPPSSFYPKGKRPHPPYDGHHPFGRRPSKPSGDESHDSFFVPWSAPEILSIEVPRIVFTSEGEWIDRSVKRSAADRLKAKRLEREARKHPEKKVQADRSGRGDETETESRKRESRSHESPSHRKEKDSGARNQSRSHETSHERTSFRKMGPPNLAVDLETYSLEYKINSLILVDTVSIQILALENLSNEDSSSDIGTSSELIRLEVAKLGPVELSSKVTILGYDSIDESKNRYVPYLDLSTNRGDHSLLLQRLQVELWRPVVLSCIHDILSSFASAAETSSRRRYRADSVASASSIDSSADSSPPLRPLVDLLPSNQSIHFAIASTRLKLGGVDPKPKLRACRGLLVQSGPLHVEYLLQRAHEPGTAMNDVNRSKLELRPDFRSDTNAMATAGNQAGKDDGRQAFLNLCASEFVIDPLVEARPAGSSKEGSKNTAESSEDRHEGRRRRSSRTVDPELVGRAEVDGRRIPKKRRHGRHEQIGNDDSIVVVPRLDLHVRIHKAAFNDQATDAGDSLDEIIIRLNAPEISLRIELFSIYLALLTFSSLRWIRPTIRLSTSDPAPPSVHKKRPKPLINFTADIRSLHVRPTLPHETHLFITFRNLVCRFTKTNGFIAQWDLGLLAGKSRVYRGKWEDIIRLQSTTISVREQANNSGHQPIVVGIETKSARLRIPYRYAFNQIIDNAASLFKATKQLVHEHVKGRWDIIIEPTNEEAKRLPEINLNIGVFAIEFDDDPLERKLNMIWRVGYEEQKARLGREKAFEVKAEAVKKTENERRDGYESSDGEGGGGGARNGTLDEKGDDQRRPKITGQHTIKIEDARQVLHGFNATQWIQRMNNASAEQARREEKLSKRLFGVESDFWVPIDLLPRSKAAPLGRATFHSMRLAITRASFGDEGVRDYLHDVGKGLPRNTNFSLLVPIHLSWQFDEARFTLRDYPLPLLHIPRNHRDNSAAWDFQTDFVVAEELGGPESVRRVKCAVIPPRFYSQSHKGFMMTVPRSAMPVKTYSAPMIKIRSGEPTRIGWGNSVQPAIQDVARVLESMTKNSPDPSDRIGFWDKIRLAIHWRVAIDFLGDKAAVIFHLKGSRDPHGLSGFGAGFAKAWAGHVKFRIGYDNPDHEFFQITSRTYILGIPNLREYLDSAATGTARETFEGADGSIYGLDSDDGTAEDDQDAASDDMSAFAEPELEQAYWIKTCAKCSGGVRWGMGLRFERACREGSCENDACKDRPIFERKCRIFDFIPHWEVHTKTPKTAPRDPNDELIDSFAGFRSDHLHFSISMTSPATLPMPSRDDPREVDPEEVEPSIEAVGDQGHNSFHFTPQAIAHFRRWWSLFDGTMSLPIRHGPVFPSTGAPSKKFGKHCATIKYRFSIAPLYISHTYAQESWSEWRRGETSAVGLKAKIGRFNVDLHQREQETVTRRDSETEPKIVRHKAFYMAEVDLDSVDLRVITALFQEDEKASIPIPDEEQDESNVEPPPVETFEGTPQDAEWYDNNDFHDSGHVFQDVDPKIRVFPFLVSPRFTYFRHVEAAPAQDSGDQPTTATSPRSHQHEHQNGPVKPTTKFGTEASHVCLMGRATDTVQVQIREAGIRLVELRSELSAVTDSSRKKELENRIEVVERIIERLEKFYRDGHDEKIDNFPDPSTCSGSASTQPPRRRQRSTSPSREEEDEEDNARLPHLKDSLYREWRDWTNRYVVHNPKIQISNDVRDLLLKYYYSSRDRKAFVYHISAAAIKFIRDLDSQDEKGRPQHGRTKSSQIKRDYEQAEAAKNRLLDDLASGGKDTNVKVDLDKDSTAGDSLNLDPDSSADDLPEDFESNASHLCMFINPQISLHSDADPNSTLILTALRVNFKTFQIVDTRVPDDPINYEVLHQNFATLDGLQAFYPHRHREPPHGRAEAIFVPIETQLEPDVDSASLERVVAPTSLRLRYDKFNHLLIHGDHKLGSKGFTSFVDRINAEGDKFVITAKAEVYVAIFNILFRLLLQSDQQRQVRNAKVKALAFTHDFSDRTTVLRCVGERQDQIRQLIPEILEYQLHLDEIDDHERRNLFALRAQLAQLSEEISLFVEGLSLAQETNGPKTSSKRPGLQLRGRATELTWTMLRPNSSPFVKASVVGVDFTWTSKDDGSTTNRLIIGDLEALNPAPDALFSEIIKKANLPASEPQAELAQANIFAVAVWDSLAPVGGIAVVERFLLKLHPVALQLEHRVGREILDYLFSERIKHRKEESSTEVDQSRHRSPKPKESIKSAYLVSNQSVDSLGSSSRRSNEHLNSPTGSVYQSNSASNMSIRSVENRLRKSVSTEVMSASGQEEGLDADEMKYRAATFRAFLNIEISETVLRLTYRSEEEDHSMIPNVYNVTCRTPMIEFSSKTTSFAGLVEDVKRQMIKSLWSQKGKLIGQILSRAHRTLPLQEQRSAVSTKVKSKLRYPLRLRRKHKQIENSPLPSSSSQYPQTSSSMLHLTTSSDSSASSSASSSVRDDLAEAVNLLDPSAEFTTEPEESSSNGHNVGSDERAANRGEDESPRSPRSQKSVPLKATSSNSSTHRSPSSPARSAQARSSSANEAPPRRELSFPFHHRPFRDPPAMSEDKKRELLLGSFSAK
ncbi:uncharacterized protein JCM6883_000150 [Sporobolomyces salmoneus]|uniref:uncharacterized protein n=1 Tax=Sporobolomyces salmoneus TaxID=183962 RepID=UPI00316C9EB0